MKKCVTVLIVLLTITGAYRSIPMRNTVPKEYGNYVRDYHYEIIDENGLVVRVFRDVVVLDQGEYVQEGTGGRSTCLDEPYIIILSVEKESEIKLVNYYVTLSCPEYGQILSDSGGLMEPVVITVDRRIRYDQNLTIELSFWELESPQSTLTAYRKITVPMLNQYRYHDATVAAMQIGIKAVWALGLLYCLGEWLRKR